MNIIINGTDFWDGFDAMKYWAPPKSYDRQKWKQEIHEYMLSGQYIGARKVDGIWAMIIKDEEGNFHLRSRTKNVEGTYADKAEWIPQILSELEDIPAGTVLLGEIYKYGEEGSRKATAILNCLKNTTPSPFLTVGRRLPRTRTEGICRMSENGTGRRCILRRRTAVLSTIRL